MANTEENIRNIKMTEQVAEASSWSVYFIVGGGAVLFCCGNVGKAAAFLAQYAFTT